MSRIAGAAALQRDVAARLRAAGVASPEIDAWRLIEAASGRSRLDLITAPGAAFDAAFGAAARARLERWTARRAAREPLQHILGSAPFYGLELCAGPGALVPRPETERLVEAALAALPPRAPGARPRVLDVGTGSGAVALAVKAERPDAELLATDVSPVALALARRNARALGLPLALLESDLLGAPAVADFARAAALLVANPPYLPEGDRATLEPEVAHDPPEALFSGADGLAHARRLAAQARALLPPGAALLLELDARGAPRFTAELERAGWTGVARFADLAGRARFVRARQP